MRQPSTELFFDGEEEERRESAHSEREKRREEGEAFLFFLSCSPSFFFSLQLSQYCTRQSVDLRRCCCEPARRLSSFSQVSVRNPGACAGTAPWRATTRTRACSGGSSGLPSGSSSTRFSSTRSTGKNKGKRMCMAMAKNMMEGNEFIEPAEKCIAFEMQPNGGNKKREGAFSQAVMQ